MQGHFSAKHKAQLILEQRGGHYTRKLDLLGTIGHQQGRQRQQRCPGGEWDRRPEKSSENLPNQQSVSIKLIPLPYRSGGFGREDQNRFELLKSLI